MIDGQDVPLRWSAADDFQEACDASGSTRPEAFAVWEAEVVHARRNEEAAPSLDVTGFVPKWTSTCRCAW